MTWCSWTPRLYFLFDFAHYVGRLAQRTNEPAAEANARINLLTTNAWSGVPSSKKIAEIIDLAVRAGALDEAVRAVVNYLWSARPRKSSTATRSRSSAA